MQYLLKEGGVRGLWRGNGINVLKIAPESAIKFGAYDTLKRMVRGNADRELKIYERFVCGSLAGGISQTVIYPLEVIYKNMLFFGRCLPTVFGPIRLCISPFDEFY